MKQFWRDVLHELKRSVPRTLYFLRHGQLHPEVIPPVVWPEYTIVGRPSAGDFTLHYAGESRRFSHDLKLLEDSDLGVNWALQWANRQPVVDGIGDSE